MANLATVTQQNENPLGLVNKFDSSAGASRICQVSHKGIEPASVQTAQQIWDAYFTKMLATFDEPNPDLNRDLALDRTVRALGQRPMTAMEQASMISRYSSSAVCYRSLASSTHFSSRQEQKLRRICAQEDALEDLCKMAFDA